MHSKPSMRHLEVTIRPAFKDDAEKICALIDQVAEEGVYIVTEPGERTVDQFRELIRLQRSNQSFLVVADYHGEIIGVLVLAAGALRKTSHVLEVGMVVSQEFRRGGIGSTLLREAIGWARQTGFYRLELGVFSTNQQAISLYKKFGFQEDGVRKSRYRVKGKWVDEVMLSKLM